MATKLNQATNKRLKSVGINVSSEEEAKERLLKVLTDNGIDGMEDEDIDTLIDIAESFVENNSGEVEEQENKPEQLADEAEAEEQEADALADEAEAEEQEADALDKIDRAELKAFIKSNGLGISVKKSMTDDDIRTFIRKKVVERADDNQKEDNVADATVFEAKNTTKKDSKRSARLDPKNNVSDRKAFEPFKALFPDKEFSYDWVSSSGVSIKYKGVNSKRGIILVENCSKQSDESIKCNLYLLTLNKQLDALDAKDIDYKVCWSGAPFIRGITLDEAVDTVKGLFDDIMSRVKRIDKKMGENRKRMEDNLKKKSSKEVKSSKKSVVSK